MRINKLPKRYRGAGVLFVTPPATGRRKWLLAQRRRSGVWSIPGGGAHRDEDFWTTATRETSEEFGHFPTTYSIAFSLRYPLFWFDWTTFVVEVPNADRFVPDRAAPHFHEFRTAEWFDRDKLPNPLHYLLRPLLLRV